MFEELFCEVEAEHIGTVALGTGRLGVGFDFDPEALCAVGDSAADRYLYQSMREPWASEFMKD